MSTNHTTNYNLNQWEATDKVLRTEFNEDNAKINAALKANADAIDALEGQMSAVQTGKGNCQIWTTSYTGTGSASHSRTFPQEPLLVVIMGDRFQLVALRPCTSAYNMEGSSYWGATASWSGTRLTLSYTGGMAGGDSKIGNESGKTYYIVALMSNT